MGFDCLRSTAINKNMGRVENRKEFIRKDCSDCRGEGYRSISGTESVCDNCGGSGMLEKEVSYKYDGERTPDEIEEEFNNY